MDNSDIKKLQNFASIPDDLLETSGNNFEDVLSALGSNLNNPGTPLVEADAQATADVLGKPSEVVINEGEKVIQSNKPGDINSLNPQQFAHNVKPAARVEYNLSELIDPEFAVMLMDMILSNAGAEILKANDINVTAEMIGASDKDKEILLRAYKPSFDTFKVGTNNPLVAMALRTVAVYSKNIFLAIKEYKSKPDEIRETVKKPARFSKPRKTKK